MDHRPKESADRARHGQPDLAAALRDRAREIERGLREPGRLALSSRAARLSRLQVREGRLEHQEAHPADPDKRCLPAIRGGYVGKANERPREHPAFSWPEIQA